MAYKEVTTIDVTPSPPRATYTKGFCDAHCCVSQKAHLPQLTQMVKCATHLLSHNGLWQ